MMKSMMIMNMMSTIVLIEISTKVNDAHDDE